MALCRAAIFALLVLQSVSQRNSRTYDLDSSTTVTLTIYHEIHTPAMTQVNTVEGVAVLNLNNPAVMISHSFACHTSHGTPDDLTWTRMKGIQRFPTNITGLRIDNTERSVLKMDFAPTIGGGMQAGPEDTGVYICTNMGVDPPQSVSLNISGGSEALVPANPNSVVLATNTAVLIVHAAAYPHLNESEIRWRNPKGNSISSDNRVSLENSNKRLVVRNAGPLDRGNYTIEIYRETESGVFRTLADTVIQLDVLLTNCISCIRSICEELPFAICELRLPHAVNITKQCSMNQCSNVTNNSLVQCEKKGPQLHLLDHRDVQICFEYRGTLASTKTLSILPGFYIIDHIRFCTDTCIDRIMIGTSRSSLPNTGSPILFHVYKRYFETVDPNIPPERSYFVEQHNFSAILSYNEALRVYEADPAGPSVCVDRGDYLGFTLSEDMGIVADAQVQPTHGYYVNATRNKCSGIASPVIDVFPPFTSFTAMSPLISVIPSAGGDISGTDSSTTTSDILLIIVQVTASGIALIISIFVIKCFFVFFKSKKQNKKDDEEDAMNSTSAQNMSSSLTIASLASELALEKTINLIAAQTRKGSMNSLPPLMASRSSSLSVHGSAKSTRTGSLEVQGISTFLQQIKRMESTSQPLLQPQQLNQNTGPILQNSPTSLDIIENSGPPSGPTTPPKHLDCPDKSSGNNPLHEKQWGESSKSQKKACEKIDQQAKIESSASHENGGQLVGIESSLHEQSKQQARKESNTSQERSDGEQTKKDLLEKGQNQVGATLSKFSKEEFDQSRRSKSNESLHSDSTESNELPQKTDLSPNTDSNQRSSSNEPSQRINSFPVREPRPSSSSHEPSQEIDSSLIRQSRPRSYSHELSQDPLRHRTPSNELSLTINSHELSQRIDSSQRSPPIPDSEERQRSSSHKLSQESHTTESRPRSFSHELSQDPLRHRTPSNEPSQTINSHELSQGIDSSQRSPSNEPIPDSEQRQRSSSHAPSQQIDSPLIGESSSYSQEPAQDIDSLTVDSSPSEDEEPSLTTESHICHQNKESQESLQIEVEATNIQEFTDDKNSS